MPLSARSNPTGLQATRNRGLSLWRIAGFHPARSTTAAPIPTARPVDSWATVRVDKHLVCALSGEIVDRDHNAARNLRDWPDMPVDAQLQRRPRTSAVPARVPQTAAQTIDPSNGLRSSHKTTRTRAAASSEGKTGAAKPAAKEPRKRKRVNDH